jgi:hypothetical protein
LAAFRSPEAAAHKLKLDRFMNDKRQAGEANAIAACRKISNLVEPLASPGKEV